MDFFDKIGKKASEAYKVTADKTGKIAKETKIRIEMGKLKTKINDLYEEIGKIVYESHVKNEELTNESVEELCTNIDVLSDQISLMEKECLDLKDKRKCPNCLKEIDIDNNYCPYCGTKQEIEEAREVEVEVEDIKNDEEKDDSNNDNEKLENQVEFDDLENTENKEEPKEDEE